MLRVYVGYDPTEDDAWRVCRGSILRRASVPVAVTAIKQAEMRSRGLYWRPADPLAATEFTYTRFLVPQLADRQGWALFMDCDMLVRTDIAELFAFADDRYAVMCVHHVHIPTEVTKMVGKAQTVYPRKNWSSVVLWNCAHPANAAVTPEFVNTNTGSVLHRFQWLDDALIGELATEWNWLVGVSAPDIVPKIAHFTKGTPSMPGWENQPYADEWRAELAQVA
ncbi:MAG: glycosyltransferase [Proteobacteria bacterium]|nr:glycosyltransferase [Pseudomonadota bacterium]